MSGTVTIPEDHVSYIVRYCLERLSYAAGDGYRLVIDLAPQLSAQTRQVIARDIRRALEDQPYGEAYADIAAGWTAALAAVNEAG